MGGAAEIYKEASHGDISMVGYGRLLLFYFLPTAGSPTHTRVYFFFFFINFYWSTVALQCYVSFYYTEK